VRSYWLVQLLGYCGPRWRGLLGLVLCCAAFLWPVAPVQAQRLLGVDVSGWETITPAQWVEVRNAGRVFAFARASYGYGGHDTQFVTHMANAKAAGLYVGAYHFSYPMYSVNHTPVNEANTFLSRARDYIGPGHLPPVLDLEWNERGLSRSALSQWANEWMDYVEAQTGVEPMIYCNTNFAQNYLDSTLANRRLWIANWPANPNPQTGNPGIGIFKAWTFWQYAGDTSLGSINGIDLNVFKGTLADLQALVGSAGTINRWPVALSRTVAVGQNATSDTININNTGIGTLSFAISVNQSWLSANPSNGTSTGPSDTKSITVSYSTATLPPGIHTATILIVASGASNSPQTVAVTMRVGEFPGDMDGNGWIDSSDVTAFRLCMTGTAIEQTDPACELADIDDDGDVDMSDFAILQRCLTGTGEPINPACVGG